MVDEKGIDSVDSNNLESYLKHEFGVKIANVVAYCDSPQKIKHLARKFKIDEHTLRFVLRRVVRQGIMRTVEIDNEEPLYHTVNDVSVPPLKDLSTPTKSEIRIALFGSIGAGKSTILHSLIAPPVSTSHIQRIKKYNIPKHVFKTSKRIAIFDFFMKIEGQLRFLKVVRPNLIILVTDSTVGDINKLKEYLPRVQELYPEVKLITIANKQDLPDAIPPNLIQEELKIPTFGLVALDFLKISLTQVIAEYLGLSLDTLGESGQWSCSRSFPYL